MSEFVVAIKPSARRTNGAVGRLVNREGTRHAFADRESAESWAAGLVTADGEVVWIREANPNDSADVDAYLVGRRRPPGGWGGRADRVDQAAIDREWREEGDPGPETDPDLETDLARSTGDADPAERTQASFDRYDGGDR